LAPQIMSPLTPEEVYKVANQIIWFADPRLIKLIEKDGIIIGYLFAYPDISEAVQRVKRAILPFGWYQLLLEMKRTKSGLISMVQASLSNTKVWVGQQFYSVKCTKALSRVDLSMQN